VAEITISLSSELKNKPVGQVVVAEIEKEIGAIMGNSVRAQISQLTMGKPNVLVVMSDFGNITPTVARQLMTCANKIVRRHYGVRKNDIRISMNATLVEKSL